MLCISKSHTPEVLLENPPNLNRMNSFLNLLTEPLDNYGWEWRCYLRDPDGYLIEVGQYTQDALDLSFAKI